MKRKIIFVEDDLILGSLIAQALENEGFEINYMNTLNGLLPAIRDFNPNLLILDIEVGNRNSLDELPSIRMNCPNIPVVIASSHTGGQEIVRSYNCGANRYIKKPYDIQELLFEINHLLPNGQPMPDAGKIQFGNYQLNTHSHELLYMDQPIKKLNPKEYEVLKLLIIKKGKMIERDELMQKVWENLLCEQSLNNTIVSLRKLLSGDNQTTIRTIKGQGYQLLY